MEMRVDSVLLKTERTKRAWSQEHLAQVTDLGLRTIQRIERSGMASNDSISAIAAAFEMTVADFVKILPRNQPGTLLALFRKGRLLVATIITFSTMLFSPPEFTYALGCLWLWVAYELFIFVVNTRTNSNVVEVN